LIKDDISASSKNSENVLIYKIFNYL